jgi:thioredoxin-like negative regulator of GroEL
LSVQNLNAVFIKVDVDKCPGTAAANSVSAMPTFVFFKNRVEIDRARGADKAQLENKIKKNLTAEPTMLGATTSSGGNVSATNNAGEFGDFIDLAPLINKAQCECLNQSDDHIWEHALSANNATYLQSDCDEQILLHITFQQAIKLHSLIIQGPEG